MNRTVDFYFTQRLIDLMIKVAGVVLTSVATYQVANSTFAHIEGPWQVAVTLGALLLVEGAFVLTWFALDTQRNAPMAMKVSWSITLVTIYVALLVIGIINGEGSAGWAFRLVLGIMIGKSVYEAGVYEVLKNSRKSDKDIMNAYSVRKLKLKVERQKAIHAMIDANTEAAYRRELNDQVDRARLEAEHEAALLNVEIHRTNLLQRIRAKDSLARGQLLASLARNEEGQSQAQALREMTRMQIEMRN
ncbi:MAG: hypothetical protein AAF564_00795 [Bacteroidota bacterium]